MKKTMMVALACAQTAAASLAAQTPLQIPIRALAPVTAKTSAPVAAIGGLQHLPDGRLLVNDSRGMRLLVFDAALSGFTVLADTSRAIGHYGGGRGGVPLIPYLGDSTLLVDGSSQSLVLIEPTGRMGRVMSPPNARTGVNMQGARADSKGRLVYRAPTTVPLITTPEGGRIPGPPADSALIVRADFDTRQLDTIARIRIVTAARPVSSVDANGRRRSKMTINPVPPALDEWTVLSDGTVAIVRGIDYHVDWIAPDAARTSTAKMPFDWRKLTDGDKQAKIDSAKKMLDSAAAAGHPQYMSFSVSFNTATGESARGDSTIMDVEFVALDAMATYISPIRSGSVKADADGNLWVLPTTSLAAKGGLLYDVVDKKGEVFERVQLPADRDIAGFGRGGIVYLSWRDGTNGYYIERTKIVMPGATIRQRPAP